MSRYGGMLLFDIADESIGKWTEDLGTRGMWVQWSIYPDPEKDSEFESEFIERLILEPDDDAVCDCRACKRLPEDERETVWSGFWMLGDEGYDSVDAYGHYEDALEQLKEIMKENPDGLRNK
jgi:hypothetical protein